MPNTVKVGCTTRLPHDRASELYTTGVPTPFHVFSYWIVDEDTLTQIEADVHNQLSNYRVHKNREFFKLNPDLAKNIISQYLDKYDEVERQREIEKARIEAENKKTAEELYKRQSENKAKSEWEGSKDRFWKEASKLAEQKYGKTLEAINASGETTYDTVTAFIYMGLWVISIGIIPIILGLFGIDLFPESKKSKNATIMRYELFAIRDAIFKQFRRSHFQKYNTTYPFDDNEPV